MKNLFKNWIEKKNQLKKAKEELLEVEKRIYIENKDYLDNRPLGTSTIEDDEYILKVVKKETITIDQKKIIDLGLTNHCAIKVKYELDKRNYKNLSIPDKNVLNDVITTRPSKPAFNVEIKGEEE